MPPLTKPVEALLRRFQGQRPLRGGSLLITLFGDAIAPRGGAMTLGSLIDLARPFGLAERLVRTSVARLAAEGWLAATRHGRRSEYRLTGSGEKLFAEATRRIYGVNPSSWEGQWTLAVLPPASGRGNSSGAAAAQMHASPGKAGKELRQAPGKTARKALGKRRNVREELRWLGFGQLSPGVYAHPSCSLEQAHGWLATLGYANHCWVLKSATEGVAADRRLAAEGWNLGEIGRRYRRFRDMFAPLSAAVGDSAHLSPQPAFLVRTLLIHEYRKIHLQDPLLPPALLPSEWVGTEAYELTAQLYSAVFAASEQFLGDTGRTISGALPPADAEILARFGGMDPRRSR